MRRRTWLGGGMAAWLGSGLPWGVPWGVGASVLAPSGSLAAGHASGATPRSTGPLVLPLQFPRDHGAHPALRTEWWYATGELRTADAQTLGFQITFFRSRVGDAPTEAAPAAHPPRRFEPRHLLFAHGALTDVAAQRQWHGERLARWNGDPAARPAYARLDDTGVAIGAWEFRRSAHTAIHPGGGRYHALLDDADFGFDLVLDTTQPLLLQGDAGYSRKGPQWEQASCYYTQPQLAASGTVWRNATQRAQPVAVTGVAWLDHEWSESLMHPEAVGWDWIGINLDDGGALTAFQLRRADGSAVWAGGSWRAAGGTEARAFGPDEVVFTPLEHWTSPGSGARYPVRWQVDTPVGRYVVQARMNAQELDSRRSTGTIYWEGLSDLLLAGGSAPPAGQGPESRAGPAGGAGRVGRGYLEMTGYAGRLRL